MLKALLVALLLTGSISNLQGRIGIRVSHSGGIGYVYTKSPAHTAGLERGDIILESDGDKGSKHVLGPAGTKVRLKIFSRKKGIYTVDVPRVPWSEVK